jgi:serine/threonine-protein kinase HipA
VYLHHRLVGNLIQDEHGQMTFNYVDSWVSDSTAVPLSYSLPLAKKHFTRNECRGYFAGILPEENKRDLIAKNLGISARNDYAMLERIGGECAGAVTFLPKGTQLPERSESYRRLTDRELADILKTLPKRPLMAGETGVRLSLAGAQDKIAVHLSGATISIPLGAAPSTHILKPAIEDYKGVVFNEAVCMKLARSIGINVAEAQTGQVEGIDYLLVTRYDRSLVADPAGGSPTLHREHQEDFCQALGIVPENKYQTEGGPSLKRCFDLLREASSAPAVDLIALLDAVIFNFLIGNHDAHGKNFSLLYKGGQTRLAPLYDLLCTSYYPELSKKMAMKIGGEYSSDAIGDKQFEQLAEEARLSKPQVKRRVPELADSILENLRQIMANQPDVAGVARIIEGNCNRAIKLSTAS